jgi:DNA polymerase-3 subunit beta
MKIIISANTLLKNLQVLSGVINTNNTIPILDNFLFDFENENLSITASDLETTMRVLEKINSNEKGCFAIPARLLLDILKTLPNQPLIFTFKETIVEIKSDSGVYEIAHYPGEEYPKAVLLENPSKTIIPSKVLANAISKTIFATGTDDLRPTFTGVFFELKTDRLNFVATDAHKLVKYTRKDLSAKEEVSFIMPKKPLNVLKTILAATEAEVEIEYNLTNALYRFGNFTLSCRLIDGKYPNYEGVIPKENPNKLIIERLQLLNSINCVSLFSNKQTNQVKLSFSSLEMNIAAEDADYSNKGDENLKCNYEGSDLIMGFNAKFLAEMLKNISSNEIQLEMSLPNRAGILTPADGLSEGEEILMLVMPSLITAK